MVEVFCMCGRFSRIEEHGRFGETVDLSFPYINLGISSKVWREHTRNYPTTIGAGHIGVLLILLFVLHLAHDELIRKQFCVHRCFSIGAKNATSSGVSVTLRNRRATEIGRLCLILKASIWACSFWFESALLLS